LRFTVRRPPNGEVSPCSHRPSGGDVACSVHVSVARSGSASLALEDRLAVAVPGRKMPAHGASLRRVRSRDLFDPTQRLVLQTRDEQSPSTAADLTVDPTFLGNSHTRLRDGAARRGGHRPYVQLLDPDHVEPLREVGAGFLDPVLTTIPVAGNELRDCQFRPLAAGASSTAGEPLLQHLQPFRLSRCQTRCVRQFTRRQGRRHGHTAVNAHDAVVAGTCNRIRDVREGDMPAARPITSNPIGLDTFWHRAREPKPHPADFGHPDPPESAVQPLDLIWLHGDLPKSFVHTGFAPPRLAMRPGEKELHGLGEIPQRLLLNGLTSGPEPSVLSTSLCQLPTLLQIAGNLATWLPVLLLFHRQIPHIPRVPAVRQQHLRLLGSRQQSEPRHTRTVATTTDIPRRSTPASQGIDFHRPLKSKDSDGRSLR